MKTVRIFTKAVLVLVFLLLFTQQAFAYSGGDGNPGDPYQIANVGDLLELAATTADYNKCFILIDDINLAGQTFNNAVIAFDTEPTNGWFVGDPFTGVFDGNDHVISNLTIDSNTQGNKCLGLFGDISNSQVLNLELQDVNIIGHPESSHTSGALVGWASDANITNCSSSGIISGYVMLGGLVGRFDTGSISECYSTATVIGDSNDTGFMGHVGGLVGINPGGSISNCYSEGFVTARDYRCVGGLVGTNCGPIVNCHSTSNVTGGFMYVGGLVGRSYGGTITDSYAIGNVTTERLVTYYVGGLVGENWDPSESANINLSCCYATGNVNASDYSSYIGGLVGRNYWGTTANCSSSGSVTTDANSNCIGGLVGTNYSGIVTDCYSTSDISGGGYMGGLLGGNFGAIINCYSAGSVDGTGTQIGGMLGSLEPGGSVTDSFWDIETSGWTTSAGGTGFTTEQMQQEINFTGAGWDFTDTWDICEGVDYPKLICQPIPICCALIMHVSAIDMQVEKVGNKYQATATVTVVDCLNNPIPWATVYGDWSGLTSGQDLGQTNSEGQANITSDESDEKEGTFTFTVTDIYKIGYTYDAAANVIDSNSIDIPSGGGGGGGGGGGPPDNG